MGKREEINEYHEAIAQKEVGPEWMTAIQIALKLGFPLIDMRRVINRNGEVKVVEFKEPENWRIVACALRRLVKKGVVEMDIIKTGPTKHRITEHTTVYRVAGVSRGMLPHWLEPQIPELRVIKRQVFRLR